MKRNLSLFLLFLALAAFAACGGDKDTGHTDDDGHDHENGDHDHEGSGHDHEGGGHDHEDGDHDREDGGNDHGERVELGKTEVGGHVVTVALLGDVEPGHEAGLDIEVEGPAPTAVRAWVGIESGKGSRRAKVDGEDGTYHGHLEVPSSLPEQSAIWLEVEAADGKRSKTSFALPRRK
jgi:hypothetical protein